MSFAQRIKKIVFDRRVLGSVAYLITTVLVTAGIIDNATAAALFALFGTTYAASAEVRERSLRRSLKDH